MFHVYTDLAHPFNADLFLCHFLWQFKLSLFTEKQTESSLVTSRMLTPPNRPFVLVCLTGSTSTSTLCSGLSSEWSLDEREIKRLRAVFEARSHSCHFGLDKCVQCSLVTCEGGMSNSCCINCGTMWKLQLHACCMLHVGMWLCLSVLMDTS